MKRKKFLLRTLVLFLGIFLLGSTPGQEVFASYGESSVPKSPITIWKLSGGVPESRPILPPPIRGSYPQMASMKSYDNMDAYANNTDVKYSFVLKDRFGRPIESFELAMNESKTIWVLPSYGYFNDMQQVGPYTLEELNFPVNQDCQVRFRSTISSNGNNSPYSSGNSGKAMLAPPSPTYPNSRQEGNSYIFEHFDPGMEIFVYNDCETKPLPPSCPTGDCCPTCDTDVNVNQDVNQSQNPVINQNVTQNPVQNVNIGNTTLNSADVAPGSTTIPSTPTLPMNRTYHIAYMVGYLDNTFRPNNSITRAEMTAMFTRLLDESIYAPDSASPFYDVAAGRWYSGYVNRLTRAGIVSGYPDGSFKPDQGVTRAEFATVASKFIVGKKQVGGFPDVANTHWASGNIQAVYGQGWVKGYGDGSFRPDQSITRAEAVSIVNKMLDRVGDRAYIDTKGPGIRQYSDLNPGQWYYYDVMEASHAHKYQRLNGGQEKWTSVEKQPWNNKE